MFCGRLVERQSDGECSRSKRNSRSYHAEADFEQDELNEFHPG